MVLATNDWQVLVRWHEAAYVLGVGDRAQQVSDVFAAAPEVLPLRLHFFRSRTRKSSVASRDQSEYHLAASEVLPLWLRPT